MKQSCISQFKENTKIDSLNDENVSTDLSIHNFTNYILDICTILIESGAHCERINRNVERIAKNTPYKINLLLSFTAISITILTWNLFERKISYIELEKQIQTIRNVKKHSIWKTRFCIEVSCACLCTIAGVSLINSIIDIMECYIPTGISRGVFGRCILLSITIDIFLSMSLIGIDNF